MILVGRKVIIEFEARHPNSRKALSAWDKVVRNTRYHNFHELKLTFPNIDYIYHRYTIFDIGGNKYRMVAEVDYLANVIHVKQIWTHAEYSMKKNNDALRGGKL